MPAARPISEIHGTRRMLHLQHLGKIGLGFVSTHPTSLVDQVVQYCATRKDLVVNSMPISSASQTQPKSCVQRDGFQTSARTLCCTMLGMQEAGRTPLRLAGLDKHGKAAEAAAREWTTKLHPGEWASSLSAEGPHPWNRLRVEVSNRGRCQLSHDVVVNVSGQACISQRLPWGESVTRRTA